jgi:H+-transporting ATPase
MEVAAIIALALSIGGGQPTEWEISLAIVLLLLVNATIGFIEQRNAGNTVKTHMQSIVPYAKVKRNDEWKVIEAAELVPGDIISLKLGDVIPADGRIIGKEMPFDIKKGFNFESLLFILAAHGGVSVDQAAVTGESFPVNKSVGDEIFSGSICKDGEVEAVG